MVVVKSCNGYKRIFYNFYFKTLLNNFKENYFKWYNKQEFGIIIN